MKWATINWIKGFENIYEINEDGQVRNIESGVVLSISYGWNYPHINLCHNFELKICRVHRLLAMAFIPNPSNKKFVNHKNGNKKDFSLLNLEWCTASYNIQHAEDNGFRESQHIANSQRVSKIVIDLNTGVFYNSATELSNLSGINRRTLTGWLNGRYKNKSNYIYA